MSNTKVCPKCGLEDREDIVNACVNNDNKRCGNLITKNYTDNMETKTGIIQVKRLEENEDGSANLEIETDVEATRLLVEVGLTRLLEMAIDKENDEYELKHTTKEDVVKIVESSMQQEVGEGS